MGIEPMDRLMFVGIVFFSLLLIWEANHAPSDGQTFQVFSGCLTGFVGAFLMKQKPPDKDKKPTPPPATTEEPKP